MGQKEIYEWVKDKIYMINKKRITINIYPDDYKYIKWYVNNNNTETNVCQLIREIIKDWVRFMKDNEKE